MIERRFPAIANLIEYWDVDEVEFADPATALSRIDELVGRLIRTLRAKAD